MNVKRLTYPLAILSVACGALQGNSAPGGGGAIETAEAGTDAGSADASDGGSSFCASHSAYVACWDFDEGQKIDDGWTGGFVTEGTPGTAALDSLAVSAPSSALLRVPKNSPTGTRAELRYLLGSTPQRFRFSFDVRLGDASSSFDSGQYVADVHFANSCELSYAVGAGGVLYEAPTGAGNNGQNFQELNTLSMGSWGRVELSIDTAARSFTLTIGGKSATHQTFFDSCSFNAPVSFNIGPHYVSTPQNDDVITRFDNVLIETY